MSAGRVFAIGWAARMAFGLVFLGESLARWPVPWYFPLERRFALASAPTGEAMGWFGTTAVALGAAALAAAAMAMASARGPLARALAKTTVVLALARTGAMVMAVDFSYFGWVATHQTATPWPELPACPR